MFDIDGPSDPTLGDIGVARIHWQMPGSPGRRGLSSLRPSGRGLRMIQAQAQPASASERLTVRLLRQPHESGRARTHDHDSPGPGRDATFIWNLQKC
jgi:hypothetical protein